MQHLEEYWEHKYFAQKSNHIKTNIKINYTKKSQYRWNEKSIVTLISIELAKGITGET